jgi:hypothetical protein
MNKRNREYKVIWYEDIRRMESGRIIPPKWTPNPNESEMLEGQKDAGKTPS